MIIWSIAGKAYEICRYVNDGDVVFVYQSIGDGKAKMVPMTVTCAAGNHARVTDAARTREVWRRTDDLFHRQPERDRSPETYRHE